MTRSLWVILLWTVAGAFLLLAIFTLAGSSRCRPRLQVSHGVVLPGDRLFVTRAESIARSTALEKLLVAIGSVELGILSFVAGFVLRSSATIGRPHLFFSLLSLLFFVTTVAYLHTWKIYMAYACYCVQLEIAGVEQHLRAESQVFSLAQNPLVPRRIRPFVVASASLEIVAMYPIAILIAVVVGFGERFNISHTVLIPLSISVLSWSAVYTAPILIEFTKLVRLSCGLTPKKTGNRSEVR